jgi:hypothetical protein
MRLTKLCRARVPIGCSISRHRTSPCQLYGVPGPGLAKYEAIEMGAGQPAGFIGTRGPDWRGLSLTMPLKRDVMPLLAVWSTAR